MNHPPPAGQTGEPRPTEVPRPSLLPTHVSQDLGYTQPICPEVHPLLPGYSSSSDDTASEAVDADTPNRTSRKPIRHQTDSFPDPMQYVQETQYVTSCGFPKYGWAVSSPPSLKPDSSPICQKGRRSPCARPPCATASGREEPGKETIKATGAAGTDNPPAKNDQSDPSARKSLPL